MRNCIFLTLLLVFSLGGCNREDSPSNYQSSFVIDEENIVKQLGEEGIVTYLKSDPTIIYVANMTPEKYFEIHSDPDRKKYFDLKIYRPIDWTGSGSSIKALCDFADTKVLLTEKQQEYILYQYKSPSCASSRMFAIEKDNLVFKIEGGQDTEDYESLWHLLQNLTFKKVP